MKNKFKFAFLAIVLGVFMVAGLGRPAHADLAAVGPVDPVTGFPLWYEDDLGLRLQLCDEGGAVAEEPPCQPELNVPALGFVEGNIGEALFYGASAEGERGVERFLAICAVEAAGPELVGDVDSVSNVALFRVRGLSIPGDYTITTPCGVFTAELLEGQDELRGEDFAPGILADEPPFSGALPGPVQIFASNFTGGLVGRPGFIGDGATPAPLEGPLFTGGGTLFTVEGPEGFAPFETDQFIVVGKLSVCTVDNLAPVANPDQAVTAAATPVIIPVLANDVNDPLQVNGATINPATVAIVTPPLEPSTAVANPDGTVTFTPGDGVLGTVTFTYTVQDFCLLTSNEATVTVFVEDLQFDAADYRTRTGRWSLNGASNFDELTFSPGVGLTSYFTSLVGGQEVPPVTSAASGNFTATFDSAIPASFNTRLEVMVPAGTTFTRAHIHLGETGTNGGILFDLCGEEGSPDCTPVNGVISIDSLLTSGEFSAVGDVANLDQAVEAIQSGRTYVNVHSVAFPGGEIRGQIGRNVIVLKGGEAGPVIGTAEVQPAEGNVKPWSFSGKSRVSPGSATGGVRAESFLGNAVVRDLSVR